MDEKPRRRWFRFRISTVLILTAIAAGMMACRPFVVSVNYDLLPGYGSTPGADSDVRIVESQSLLGLSMWHQESPNLMEEIGLNHRLQFPVLALAAFLAWKAAWAVIERRRRLSA